MKPRRGRVGPRGFTLVEVLVALAIVALALIAALRASAQATVDAAELRGRMLAGWVAQNVLNERRARGDWPALGVYRGHTRQGGLEFEWREDVAPTPNAAFRRLDVLVFDGASPTRPLARVSGFLVMPSSGAR